MKPGDIFSRMQPETRVRKLVLKQYHFQEIYSDPKELIEDLSALVTALDAARASAAASDAAARRLVAARDEITTDISAAFRRFDHIFRYILIPVESQAASGKGAE